MNRYTFTQMVRESLGGTATNKAASMAIDAVILAIQDGLAEDGDVLISEFGRFALQDSPARRLLLPKTGKELVIPARRVLRFKASASCQKEQ